MLSEEAEHKQPRCMSPSIRTVQNKQLRQKAEEGWPEGQKTGVPAQWG